MSRTVTRTRKATRRDTAAARARRIQYTRLAARLTKPGDPAAAMPARPMAARVAQPVTSPAGPVSLAADAPVPVNASVDGHVIELTGEGDAWRASCSCSQWSTGKDMKRASAKGAHTKHRNAALLAAA